MAEPERACDESAGVPPADFSDGKDEVAGMADVTGAAAIDAPAVEATRPAGEPPRPRGSDWFSELFGYAENSYDEARRWMYVVQGRGPEDPCFIKSFANEKQYCVGVFETPSLAGLRERGGTMSLPGRLTVRNETGDVSTKHALPENRYATFQVASQFNCLEFVGPRVTPEDGITGYLGDKTQGPACSIACGPATAFRNYFAPMDAQGRVVNHTEAVQHGQIAKSQIDNLVDLGKILGNEPHGKLYEMIGGYSMADRDQIKRLNAALGEFKKDDRMDELRAALRVGVHRDVQVTSCNWGSKQIKDPEHLVTQVFGSACAVAYNRGSNRADWADFATLVLEASYEATLWAALESAVRHGGKGGSRRVFLTCLGGGVFGNSMGWITQAMQQAFEKFKDCDLDVRIISFRPPIESRLEALEKAFPPSK